MEVFWFSLECGGVVIVLLGCDGNSGCAAAVGNVGGWRSVLIGWIGSVISGIAVSTRSWKQDVSSWTGCPAVDQDNGPEGGAPVWISIRWAAGSARKSTGFLRRTTIGRSLGKKLAVAARSRSVPCVQPGDPSMRSHDEVAVEQQLKLQRPPQCRLWFRSSTQQTRASGQRTPASGCSAGRAQLSRQPVRSPKPLRIRLPQEGHCRVPAAAVPINGWREANVG